jgi:hypothetical protein
MHPVAPRTGADEITIAEEQLEYRPLVGAVYVDADGVRVVLTRWRLNDEDKRKAAQGEDLTIAVRVFNGPFPPLMVGFDLDEWMCPTGGV